MIASSRRSDSRTRNLQLLEAVGMLFRVDDLGVQRLLARLRFVAIWLENFERLGNFVFRESRVRCP